MALPLAVADASVLIALHHLDLLPSLSLFYYHKVLVPAEVRRQFFVKAAEKDREAALTILTSGSIFTPCEEYDTIQVELYLLSKLDHGEAEALSQATVLNIETILIDERRGRRVAEQQRKSVRGTLGILARLDFLGIAVYFDCINKLREQLGFHVSQSLAERVYQQAKRESE